MFNIVISRGRHLPELLRLRHSRDCLRLVPNREVDPNTLQSLISTHFCRVGMRG